MPPVDLLENVCDPACELQECLRKQLPSDWKSKGCKGDISVDFIVSRLTAQGSAPAKIRDCSNSPRGALLEVRIETDRCTTVDCAAGKVHAILLNMLWGEVDCCCAVLDYQHTDINTNLKPKREIRVMRFSVDLLPKENNKSGRELRKRLLHSQG